MLGRFVLILLYDWLILTVFYFLNIFSVLEIPFQLVLPNKVSTVLGFLLALFIIVFSAFLINKKFKAIPAKPFVISQTVFLFLLLILFYLALTAVRDGIMGF